MESVKTYSHPLVTLTINVILDLTDILFILNLEVYPHIVSVSCDQTRYVWYDSQDVNHTILYNI